jgi:hypothetical protein
MNVALSTALTVALTRIAVGNSLYNFHDRRATISVACALWERHRSCSFSTPGAKSQNAEEFGTQPSCQGADTSCCGCHSRSGTLFTLQACFRAVVAVHLRTRSAGGRLQ